VKSILVEAAGKVGVLEQVPDDELILGMKGPGVTSCEDQVRADRCVAVHEDIEDFARDAAGQRSSLVREPDEHSLWVSVVV
jgi:hypothetical protein